MKNQKILKFILLGVFILVIGGFYFSGLGSQLSLENLINQREFLIGIVEEMYLIAVLIYILLYVLVIVFSLPGGGIMTMTGGLLFGWIAILYVNIAATIGATGAFLSSRFLFGEALQEKFKDRLTKFNKEFEKEGNSYLIIMRLTPAIPFFIQNILAGLTKAKVRNFIWTTSLAILPGSAAYVFAGIQLREINDPSEILSRVSVALIALFALSLIPIIVKRVRRKKV
jgi:uncharacterized membrane protein YdjX (TVP38/TMEM64 family)